MSKSKIIAITLLIFIYAGISTSPLRKTIGRAHPLWAAFFSAPTFNFHETYTTGEVLDFRIGMSKQEFATAAEAYIDSVWVHLPCDGP